MKLGKTMDILLNLCLYVDGQPNVHKKISEDSTRYYIQTNMHSVFYFVRVVIPQDKINIQMSSIGQKIPNASNRSHFCTKVTRSLLDTGQ